MLNEEQRDERFKELRCEWLKTLKRTNYFFHPDTDPPKIPKPSFDEPMTVHKAIDIIADALGATRELLMGDYRHPGMCRKRYIFYRIMRDKFPLMAQNALAKKINRDSTTVVAGLKKFRELIEDSDFRAEYDRVRMEVG